MLCSGSVLYLLHFIFCLITVRIVPLVDPLLVINIILSYHSQALTSMACVEFPPFSASIFIFNYISLLFRLLFLYLTWSCPYTYNIIVTEACILMIDYNKFTHRPYYIQNINILSTELHHSVYSHRGVLTALYRHPGKAVPWHPYPYNHSQE